jgi:hypothetical protein
MMEWKGRNAYREEKRSGTQNKLTNVKEMGTNNFVYDYI